MYQQRSYCNLTLNHRYDNCFHEWLFYLYYFSLNKLINWTLLFLHTTLQKHVTYVQIKFSVGLNYTIVYRQSLLNHNRWSTTPMSGYWHWEESLLESSWECLYDLCISSQESPIKIFNVYIWQICTSVAHAAWLESALTHWPLGDFNLILSR